MGYLEMAKDLVDHASRSGAEAEAIIMESQTTMIRVDAGEMQELSRAGSRGLGMRIIKEHRTGYAYTSDFSGTALEDTWRGALALAESADADEFRGLPQLEKVAVDEDLQIYDPQFLTLTTKEKVAFILNVERAALEYDPRIVATSFCTYEDSLSRVYLANSRGFVGSYENTGVVAYLRAVARDEDGQTAGLGLGFSTLYKDLHAQEIGREAARRAVQLLGGQPVQTQKAAVIMDPLVAVEFLSFVSAALTAETVQKGRSFLMDKLGQKVASNKVSLVDDGRLPGGWASAPFDDEGVPTSAIRLIAEGTLKQLLYDTYSARKDGTRSTGNAQRGSYRDLPSPAPTNFYLEPSSQPLQEVIAGVENGLYMTNSMNTGGINPVNGDYSVGASGLWLEKGQFLRPVTGVTVAGNMLDMLQNVVAVGADLRFIPIYGSIGAPTIVIEDMTIGGR
jgi:PmbA protein